MRYVWKCIAIVIGTHGEAICMLLHFEGSFLNAGLGYITFNNRFILKICIILGFLSVSTYRALLVFGQEVGGWQN